MMKWSSSSSGDRVRLLCSALGLAVLAPYLECLFRHTCMGGHLCVEHGPYTIWPYANDAVWVMLLPAVAVMCWWSNMYGKQIFSLALLFLVATNLNIMTGILPSWWQVYPKGLWISVLAAVGIPFVGLFIGGRAGRFVAPESDRARTRRVMLVGIGVVAGVMCFMLGLLSGERQRELAEQRNLRGRVGMLLTTYKAVESTNWGRAHNEVGKQLLDAMRDYQSRFGIEKGTNRYTRMFSEALAIADAVERQALSEELAQSNLLHQLRIDPTTGLPLDPTNEDTSLPVPIDPATGLPIPDEPEAQK